MLHVMQFRCSTFEAKKGAKTKEQEPTTCILRVLTELRYGWYKTESPDPGVSVRIFISGNRSPL